MVLGLISVIFRWSRFNLLNLLFFWFLASKNRGGEVIF